MSINDVLVGLLAGALRNYQLRQLSGQHLDGRHLPKPEAQVPAAPSATGVTLTDAKVAVPVNLRRAADSITMNNKFAAAFIDLPVSLPGPPSARVLEANRRTQFVFDTAAPIGYYLANVALVVRVLAPQAVVPEASM